MAKSSSAVHLIVSNWWTAEEDFAYARETFRRVGG